MFEPGVSRLNFADVSLSRAQYDCRERVAGLRSVVAEAVWRTGGSHFHGGPEFAVKWNSWECNVRSRTRAVRGKTAEWSAIASGFKTCLCKVLRPASWNLTQNWRSWLVRSSHTEESVLGPWRVLAVAGGAGPIRHFFADL